MSRRRREREEGPKGFDFPEFDEREFIRKEMISFRSAMVLFAWSILTAAVSFVVWLLLSSESTGWYVGIMIAAGMGYMLRWILPAMKVDIGHFAKKEWFGTGALFFFSWLAFFILIMNPPIHDGVQPDLEIHVTPSAQELGGTVNITVIATDNVAVDTRSIDFAVFGPDDQERASTQDLWLAVDDDAGVWSWGFTPEEEGTYRVEASVADTASGSLIGDSHTKAVEAEFQVGETIQVGISSGGEWETTREVVTVHLPAGMDVYQAWLENTLENDTTVRVYLEHDEGRSTEERQEWFAEPRFEGFAQGENRFRVHVEEHNTYYLGLRFDRLGTIAAPLVSPEEYTVNVTSPGLLGEYEPELDDKRDPTIQPIPGPAAGVAIVALFAALAWVRRRREGRDQSASLSGH